MMIKMSDLVASNIDDEGSVISLSQVIPEIFKLLTVNKTYDVPYLAGYSRDGKTVYIDRHIPNQLVVDGKTIEVAPILALHETVEKALIDKLGIHYESAHQIALTVEKAAIENAGVSWDVYNNEIHQYVKELGAESDYKVPEDLDMTPYQDEHDIPVIQSMDDLTKK
jgi:hypothetical protein